MKILGRGEDQLQYYSNLEKGIMKIQKMKGSVQGEKGENKKKKERQWEVRDLIKRKAKCILGIGRETKYFKEESLAIFAGG